MQRKRKYTVEGDSVAVLHIQKEMSYLATMFEPTASNLLPHL